MWWLLLGVLIGWVFGWAWRIFGEAVRQFRRERDRQERDAYQASVDALATMMKSDAHEKMRRDLRASTSLGSSHRPMRPSKGVH